MTKKPVRHTERLEVHYDKARWQLLKTLRSQAVNMMEALEKANIATVTHGSIARGDVTPNSDIDIFLTNPPSSFMTETTLEKADIPTNRRLIIQATPFYAVKGYIEVDKQRTVSFSLVKMRKVERDFYRFGGEVTLAMLREDRRVAGVDKRLMLIEPTAQGHIESSTVGREEETAKTLRIPLETILDRVHALLRRDKVGRTGVFIERELTAEETFEMALKKLAETKPEVRRRLKLYEK
ncbi:MAG: nucleotidyltransferase domain-containing protein [Candidatus Bathyarchaeia archaeon]